MKPMVWSEMKEKDNNMTLTDHDDEVWVVFDEDKVDFEGSEDFQEVKEDLK